MDESEGWTAVAPADQVITNTVHQRGNAEYPEFNILGPVEIRSPMSTSTTSSKSMPTRTTIANRTFPTSEREPDQISSALSGLTSGKTRTASADRFER